MKHQQITALYLFGKRSVSIGYLETSQDLLDPDIAEDILEAHGKKSTMTAVLIYLRGIATVIIGEGC